MTNHEPNKQAMSAMTGVKSEVGQVGLAKVTLGAAVYAAHIRQMDRRNTGQRRMTPRQLRQEQLER